MLIISSLCIWDCDNDFLAYELGEICDCAAIMCYYPANAMKLVAVITSSFQVIREESRTSAFTIEEQ